MIDIKDRMKATRDDLQTAMNEKFAALDDSIDRQNSQVGSTDQIAQILESLKSLEALQRKE